MKSEKYSLDSIECDANINRLLDACALKETDHVPSFENVVMKRSMKYILGIDKIKEIMHSKEMQKMLFYYSGVKMSGETIWQSWEKDIMEWMSILLPPKDNLELLQLTGVDCASVWMAWVPFVRPFKSNVAGHQKGVVKDWKDLKKVKVPPTQVEKMIELLDWYLETCKDTSVGVGPICRSCFTSTYEVLGMENFLIKLYRDRKLVETTMDIFTDYAVQITEAVSKRDIDCFWLEDDLCASHGFLANPKLIKELWVPRTEKMLKPLIDKGIPIYMHCCGNVEELIPIITEMGISALHPIQPNCNDIYDLKKKHGDKIALIGNMDIGGVLSFGTPEEVYEDTINHIEKLAHGGGYVAGSSHSIVDTVPPENYMAKIKASQTYKKNSN